MYYVLNRKREPVPENSIIKWGRSFNKNRRVALTELPNGGTVSTVFLGLDHRFSGDGPPLLFETMVFTGGEDKQYRTSTWDEATNMHCRVVLENGGELTVLL